MLILYTTNGQRAARGLHEPSNLYLRPLGLFLLGKANNISPFIQIWTSTVDISSQYASKNANFFPAFQELSLILKSVAPDEK